MSQRFTGIIGKMTRDLRAAGFTIEMTGGNHVYITAPDGTTATQPLTPGNRSAQEKYMKKALQRRSFRSSRTEVVANGR